MLTSSNQIVTTHMGSLPRSPEYRARLADLGGAPQAGDLDEETARAVEASLRRQVEAGLSIVNDGEQGKTSWAVYVRDRLDGLSGEEVPMPRPREADEFPDFYQSQPFGSNHTRPTCDGPLSWKDFSGVEKDIANLKAAAAKVAVEDLFLSASSPGTISNFHPNRYYPSEEEYLHAIADVMQREYEAITAAGIVLQIDCPDLASQSTWFPEASDEEFRKIVALRVEALNYATRNIPPESMRVHICWGRGEAGRIYSQPLRNLVDLYLKARPMGLHIVGCNGRHEHEWKVWQEVKLPDDKILVPGVIDNTTMIIEHPETVADRITRYASVVGRERVIASVNCGFGNWVTSTAGMAIRDERMVWAKLKALADGAALATKTLWPELVPHDQK